MKWEGGKRIDIHESEYSAHAWDLIWVYGEMKTAGETRQGRNIGA